MGRVARGSCSWQGVLPWACLPLASVFLLCACHAGGERAPELPREQRVEAEAFEQVTPRGARVRLHDDGAASGRTCLVGFAKAETVSWRIPAAPRPRLLWIRYASRGDLTIRWWLGSSGAPASLESSGEDWHATEVPASGSLEGEGAFRWAALGPVPASPRPLRLALRGAGLRPDCFALTDPAEVPAEGMPDAPGPSPAALAALADAPPRPSADWIASASGITLPDWIEKTRVGLHTRLSVAWVDRPLFQRAEEAAASLGAPALVRHVKSMRGACYWPSSVGETAAWVAGATRDGRDPVEQMADRAHARSIAFVAYYRHQEDRPLAGKHPDWVCRDVHGRTIRTHGEPRLCFHSPFAEATRTRLLELAERGADGIYLDEAHQPLDGCWCEWTQRAFERATGLPLPRSDRPDDPIYRRFLAFTEDSLAQRLASWRTALAARSPGIVLLVSTHRQPDLLGARPTLRLATVGDLVKTEFGLGAPQRLLDWLARHPSTIQPSHASLLELGWATSRDGGFGRPAHVWIHGLASAARWRAATGAILASGNLANLDHPEETLPDPGAFGPAFELARSLSTPLASTRPLRTILLHLPERARNALLPDEEAAWSKTVEPFLRAWEGLRTSHLPAAILSDDLLAAGLPEETRLLFLPAPTRLEPAQRDAVRRFEEAGGSVVRADPSELLERARRIALPVRLVAPAQVAATWLRAPDGALVLGLSNDPGWLLDPASKRPPVVRDARLRVERGGRSARPAPAIPSNRAIRAWRSIRAIRAWPGEGADLAPAPPPSELLLPAFQDALVLRIEPGP